MGFTRNTAGMLYKAPQDLLLPQASPKLHPCWNISL